MSPAEYPIPPRSPAPPGDAAPVRHVLAVGRGTALAAGVVFSLLTAWSAGTAWYFVHRDDFAGKLLAKHAAMQDAYEDRIAALRTRLDRVASQKLIEQDSLEGRLEGLVGRQVQIETRQAILSTLAEQSGAAAPPRQAVTVEPVPADLPAAASAYAPARKPAPEDPFALRLRGSSLQRPLDPAMGGASSGDRLAAVERSIGAVEAAQLRSLAALDRQAAARVQRMRQAIGQTGLNPDELTPPDGAGGMGGPLVPLTVDPAAGPFEAGVDRLQTSLVTLDRLRRTSAALPFARPIVGEPDLTSGFGMRFDPFTRGPAMHTGLDFRAEHGSRVTATAAGRVVAAEHAGGYGNMVEVDHGNGITTRYAHLSAMSVTVGQRVAAGQALGRVGSTGRSTGPHLHYETRLSGDAVDPQRFLRAGAKLAAAALDEVASR
ncbi:M23 family metallopeptidase [Salinarimonas soli]|uniref:M23 family metallopeptidase n=1 Tax=Salinarimonas soli TaxID=1638099 RepID=A0A5B2V9K6_9HYPH|nr:M23 family metallopeptidase [Salinarimonas soli]KAA2235275.1 M23 family metallopeptidase [Salinarimonas soli]